MILVVSIDIGSTYTKAIMMDETRAVRAPAILRSGYQPAVAAASVYEDLLANAGVTREDVTYVATSGYGRYMVHFRHTLATIYHFSQVRTILDIGGQDIKAIRIDECGHVRAFWLNDKCAAGTGAFLEKTARYLGLKIGDIGPYVLRSTKPVEIISVRGIRGVRSHQSSFHRGRTGRYYAGREQRACRSRFATDEARRSGKGFCASRRYDAECSHGGGDRDKTRHSIEPAPQGLGQLNGAFGAALLGLWRVDRLLSEGRVIPAPGGDIAAEHGIHTSRRWSTFVPATREGITLPF